MLLSGLSGSESSNRVIDSKGSAPGILLHFKTLDILVLYIIIIYYKINFNGVLNTQKNKSEIPRERGVRLVERFVWRPVRRPAAACVAVAASRHMWCVCGICVIDRRDEVAT